MRGVVIAYPSERLALQLKRELTVCGIEVLAVCAGGSAVLNLAGTIGEAVVVCPLILPDMPANHLAETLPASFDIIALSKTDPSLHACSNLFVLTLPLSRDAFTALALSLCARQSSPSPKRKQRAPDEAALLDKAKKILMRKGMSEPQAHKYLQRSAMTRGIKITEQAQRVVAEHTEITKSRR